jgi:hypothetical protein
MARNSENASCIHTNPNCTGRFHHIAGVYLRPTPACGISGRVSLAHAAWPGIAIPFACERYRERVPNHFAVPFAVPFACLNSPPQSDPNLRSYLRYMEGFGAEPLHISDIGSEIRGHFDVPYVLKDPESQILSPIYGGVRPRTPPYIGDRI